MPTRKQRRRREKLQRHEWEEVYVDDDGNELDPEDAEELAAQRKTKVAKAAPDSSRQGGRRRALEPPSLRRTLRRGLLFFPLMLLTVFLLGGDLGTGQKVVQTIFLLLIFLPFTHMMDVLLWRSYRRRLAKEAEKR